MFITKFLSINKKKIELMDDVDCWYPPTESLRCVCQEPRENKACLPCYLHGAMVIPSFWISRRYDIPRRKFILNKANLRDSIAATGLVISNWIQIVNFPARVTVKFDGWPKKTIGHFFYTLLSFGHHFKSIGEFKLDLQSETLNSGRSWWYVIPCDLEIWQMTLQNNRHLFYAISSFVHHFVPINEFKLE